jgi:hypothetical protein
MNINDASKPPQIGETNEVSFDVPGLAEPADTRTLSANIAKLETDLANEREDRREKEFIYIAIIALLGAAILYKFLDNVIVWMSLFLFIIVIITGLASRMGVDWAVTSFGWLRHTIAGHFGKNEDKKGEN